MQRIAPILSALLCLSLVPQARAETNLERLQQLNDAFADLVAQVKPGVVAINTETVVEAAEANPFDQFFRMPRRRDGQRQLRPGLGSGVIVSADGYILTNNHVIAGSRRRDQVADRITVEMVDKRTFEAKVIGRDPLTDLAVLKIDAKDLPTVDLGDSDALRVGEWVLAIGNPRGQLHTVTRGIVSALGRSEVGLTRYEDFIQTDASINPGNSGGALVNMRGQLVGINTAIASQSGGAEGIGFAIPVNMARDVMQKLIADGEIRRGFLGVGPQDIGPDIAEAMDVDPYGGVLVSEVVAGSAAAKAGLKVGDVILKLDGTPMKSADQLRDRLGTYAPGAEVKLEILREGKKKNYTVKLGELETGRIAAAGPKRDDNPLGLQVETLTAQLKEGTPYEEEKGVVITQVEGGSPADRAGLRRGDLVVEVNRQAVEDANAFYDALDDVQPGDSVLFLFNRGGNTRFVAVRVPK